ETEIERMLGVQRELQVSQIEMKESIARIEAITERNAEAIGRTNEAVERLERSVESLVRVATAQQDSIEGLNRRIDRLDQGEGNT
ncbi:MAG: hypothetical protein AAGB01_10510, partial [Cyanobacteria bacterium P01_F01_bin.42]